MGKPKQGQGGYWYARAICESGLPATARHIGHMLASKADNTTGQITISLSAIAADTGLSKRAVVTHLGTLEAGGFLRRRRPETWQALGRGEMTAYTLLIPDGYPTKSAPTHPSPSAGGALPSAGGALPLVHMTASSSAPGAHTTKGLSTPPPAGAVAGAPDYPDSPGETDEPAAPTPCDHCGTEQGNTYRYALLACDQCGHKRPAPA